MVFAGANISLSCSLLNNTHKALDGFQSFSNMIGHRLINRLCFFERLAGCAEKESHLELRLPYTFRGVSRPSDVVRPVEAVDT